MSDNSSTIDRTRGRKGRREEEETRSRITRVIMEFVECFIQVHRTLSFSSPTKRRDSQDRRGHLRRVADRNRIDFYDTPGSPVVGNLLLHAGR